MITENMEYMTYRSIYLIALLIASSAATFCQPTITGANAVWWFGSGILHDGSGCATNSNPCYYTQAAWTANANGASGTPTWHVSTNVGGGNISLSCTTC